MPSSRTRRSRAPSPEPHSSSTGAAIFANVAKGILEYSIHHYLTRQASPTTKHASPADKTPREMPGSSDRSTRAFGFNPSSNSNSRRDDPTHELISHLLRGAAALAARHFLSKRGKKKDQDNAKAKSKTKTKPKATRPRDEFVGAPVPERRRHGHRHRHGRRPHRHQQQPKTELVVALDSLSAELARTSARIRALAGGRRPHRHRDGRCDVYEGLVGCAGRLEGEVERVRTGVNNIRNLEEGQLGRREVYGRGENRGEGSWVRTGPVPAARAGSYVRMRPGEGRSGSYVRTRDVQKEKGSEDEGRKFSVAKPKTDTAVVRAKAAAWNQNIWAA
ncbi:hypothetical protein CONLIGDRAFT_719623 [Coniochaeta ligniaria NRRL 30616]|uniref:Uncharacterized protein n=1 Tax=Coniochaeta ligniaria NRRL 30616 TaxID=1408157 RepID=A0A1J7I552_9PEZI|nr:hypothetical protein CONLIGDRAFT_719623 [Coniochaeta ligniaria NRRL 30616]